MPPRYTKQRDKFRCGPIAILNALRWVGVSIPYKELLPSLERLCECVAPDGTRHAAFDRTLREVGKDIFTVRRVHHPSLAQIEEHLREGGHIILNYRWTHAGMDRRHFESLVEVSLSGRSFYVVNGSLRGPALRKVTRTRFKEYDLRFQRVDPSFKAWFLTKRG